MLRIGTKLKKYKILSSVSSLRESTLVKFSVYLLEDTKNEEIICWYGGYCKFID